MTENKLYALLAFAGASPFLACALLPLAGLDSIEPLGRLDALASSYGLAIISFLAGIHWATYLFRASHTPFNLLVSSNVVFLAVWFAFVLAGVALQLVIQILAFLVLLFVDYRLLGRDVITRDYFGVRTIATAIACISLSIIVLTDRL